MELSEVGWVRYVFFDPIVEMAETDAHLIGSLFHRNLKKAVQMHTKQSSVFVEFTSTFPPAVVQKWDNMVQAWVLDQSKPDPYAEPIVGKYFHWY